MFKDNQTDPPKYDGMKVALARHDFAWLHPFSNGNGRVVRLLTYALLSGADAGEPAELENLFTYVLSGIRDAPIHAGLHAQHAVARRGESPDRPGLCATRIGCGARPVSRCRPLSVHFFQPMEQMHVGCCRAGDHGLRHGHKWS